MNANLMPVCLIQDGSTEDDDVADNAETVKDRQCCHQTQEGRLHLGDFSLDDMMRNEGPVKDQKKCHQIK